MSGMKFVVLGIAAGAFFVWTGMPQTGYQMNDQQLISNASLEDSSAQLEKAMALAANEYFDDALAILDDVVIENPNNSLALTIRGVMYRKIGRYSEAISDFDNAIKLDSENASAYCHRAFSVQQIGQSEWWKQALLDTEKSIALEKDNALAYLIRGNALVANEQFEAAIGAFDHAIAYNPNSSNSLVGRARAHAEIGQFQKAKSDLRRASELRIAKTDQEAFDTTAQYINALIEAKN
jgi:tetratricopeptide (TPR) repeat protein